DVFFGRRSETISLAHGQRARRSFPMRSHGGLVWETLPGPATLPICVWRDDAEPDPARRFKAVFQGAARPGPLRTIDDVQEFDDSLRDAARAGALYHGMFAGCSPDGSTWPEIHSIVRETYARDHPWWVP